jgi:hypothetical protein
MSQYSSYLQRNVISKPPPPPPPPPLSIALVTVIYSFMLLGHLTSWMQYLYFGLSKNWCL